MIRTPLTLEALALRRVIKERGIQGGHTDLVPRMRKELEELARLPGVYEIVGIQMDKQEEGDEEAEHLPYSDFAESAGTTAVRIGGRMSVSCPTVSSWMVQGQGGNLCRTDGPVPLYDLSLEGETVSRADSVTFFRERFVEDGILKSVVWVKQELEGRGEVEGRGELEGRGEVEWSCRQDSFQLDPTGALTWICRVFSCQLKETLVFTTLARRVSI